MTKEKPTMDKCLPPEATPQGERSYIQGGSYAQDATCNACGRPVRKVSRNPDRGTVTLILSVPDQDG